MCIALLFILGIPGVVSAQDYFDGAHTWNNQRIINVNGQAVIDNGSGGYTPVPNGAEIYDGIGESLMYYTSNARPRQIIGRTPQNFGDLIDLFLSLIAMLIPTVFALALLFFIWGLAQFIWAAGQGNEDKIKAGKQLMFWGVIALFVMVSIWGIVEVLGRDFGVRFPIQLLQT